nr:tetratricopeptide repeat protein [Nitrospirillum iridis]
MLDGQWAAAAAHYQQVTAVAPGELSAWADLGVALLQLGRTDNAVAAFNQALALDDGYAPALINLGVALRRLGRLDEAADTYRRAGVALPGNAELQVNLGNVLADLDRLPEAAAAYRQALASQPGLAAAQRELERLMDVARARDAAMALNGTGNAHFGAQRWQAAADDYGQALALWPGYADAQGNLGNALRALGRVDDAIAAYRRAADLQPDEVGHWCNLSMILQADGQAESAAAAARRAVAMAPVLPLAHACLGMSLRDLGQADAAVEACRQALALDPDLIEARVTLVGVLLDEKRWVEAEEVAREAVARNPSSVEGLVSLAGALHAQDRAEEAMELCHRALALRPDHETAALQLAGALHRLNREEEAKAVCIRSLGDSPRNAETHNMLGVVLLGQGRTAEAAAAFQEALVHKPAFIAAHVNLGMTHLLEGRWRQGWAEYEWRLKDGHQLKPWEVLPDRAWRGQDITGRTLMVHGEQGMGDLIQFCRFADRRWWDGVGRSGPPAYILMRVPTPLARVISSVPGVDGMLVGDAAPDGFDFHAPLLSLPHLLAMDTVPAVCPYMEPPSDALAGWRNLFAAEQGGAPFTGLRVGLVWAGNPEHKGDRQRSVHDLAALGPLWSVPGVRWYSLQVGGRAGDVHRFPPGKVTDLSGRLGDYAETAAAIMQLDLVVAVDTSVAHLAGALGKPVWILLPTAPDWRWLRHRQDSPWYPSARLFRQTRAGDWGDPVAAIAADLARGIV